MRLKLSLLFVFIFIYSWSQTTTPFTSSGTFNVPAGIISITGQAWGGGGSGGGASGAGLLAGRGAAGGGGGAYVSTVLTVTPGAALSVVVAGQTSGTSGANGTAGGSSTITGFETSFLAVGGSGGGANTGTAPGATAGGTTAASFGTTKIAGGAGGAGDSALLSLGLSSGVGGAGGNSGGAGGGANSSAVLGNAAGKIGTAPGGGGSGAINSALGAAQIGGTGGAGQVSITYTCPTYNITGTAGMDVCASTGTTSTVTLTSSAALLPVGNYVVTYNRSSPSATGLTANMTVSVAGTGTFTAVGLTTLGSSTITVTNLTSGACSSNITTTNTATITISAATAGGTVNGGTTICSGGTSALLTLSGHTGSVVKWQFAVSPFSSWTDIVNTGTTYTSGALTVTTQFRAVVQSGTCISANSAVTTVTVNTLPTITLSASATSVCSNASAQNTILSYSGTTETPTTYSIVWNSSPTNSFAAVTDVALPASPITIAVPAGTVADTYVGTLTVKNANSCVSSPGYSFNVTVNTMPTAPVIGAITLPTCAIPTGSVALSGLPSGGILTKYPGGIVVAYTGTATTVSGLVPNTYTFTVGNGNCTSASSGNAVVPGLVTNTYTTVWSNGTPTVDQNIIFAGDYSSSGDLIGCTCYVNSGINVTINSDHTLIVDNAVTVSGGNLVFSNNASLVQVNNVVNSGNITYRRNAAPMKAFDYTYWSSPVIGQVLNVLSPNTLSDKFLSYNSGWVTEAGTNTMTAGKGYIIRVPKEGSWFNGENVGYPYSQPVQFIGKPNNGPITGETVITGNSYLIGNPYPSALDADAFLAANNTILGGTIHFWTHNTAIAQSGSKYVYSSNDYASYNGVGSTDTKPAISGGATPSGKIGAGQSFFGTAVGNGAIQFTNTMRVVGNNSQFFKPGHASKETNIVKSRVWINLTNAEGAFKQILIGYVGGATNDYDNNYDGLTLNGNNFVDFYSINNTSKLVIQGRALPFEDTDAVPLGYKSTIGGNFIIGIDKADGLLKNQTIFLEDKITGLKHNLSRGSYTFNTAIGTFDNRFVLRYTNKTLGTGEFETPENTILVSVGNKEIKISAFNQIVEKVFIYDLSGKLIYSKDSVSDSKLVIDPEASGLKTSNQVLLIKVVLDNNHTETQKVIY
jgi:hypothetical protein